MRDTILNEIRRITDGNGGKVPGVRTFEKETGIRQAVWRGKLWARWSDAVAEAGLDPNQKQSKLTEDFVLNKLAEACLHFGRYPSAMDLRMYLQVDNTFPHDKTIARQFGSLKNAPYHLVDWAKKNGRADIRAIVGDKESSSQPVSPSKEGLVYLIKSGRYYKIGRSEELERRIKEIRTALPDAASVVHFIRTDDPSGIESYWHRRFADRRANGEWFKLATADVAAFKKRRYQ